MPNHTEVFTRQLISEQLKEGYNLIDEAGDKYAVLEDTLSERVKVYFGLTKHKEKNNIAPPARVPEATKPETQGNMTPDSHSGGAIPMTKRGDPEEAGEGELPHHHEDILQSSSTEHSEKQPPQKSHVSADEMDKSKLGTLDIIHPSNLRIPKFRYNKSKMQSYENIFLQEFPDGIVVLGYKYSHYYTTKEKVMKLPYPFPEKYFSKENGWSSNIEIAFKKYRKYLAETLDGNDGRCKVQTKSQAEINPGPQSSDCSASSRENSDDWKYKPLLKKDTKGNHGEDYEKIEGSLEESTSPL